MDPVNSIVTLSCDEKNQTFSPKFVQTCVNSHPLINRHIIGSIDVSTLIYTRQLSCSPCSVGRKLMEPCHPSVLHYIFITTSEPRSYTMQLKVAFYQPLPSTFIRPERDFRPGIRMGGGWKLRAGTASMKSPRTRVAD